MPKFIRIVAIAAFLAAPTGAYAQGGAAEVLTLTEKGWTMGSVFGPLGAIAGGLIGTVLGAGEVIIKSLQHSEVTANPGSSPATSAAAKAAAAPSRTKVASLRVNPPPRYEGRSIARRHSSRRPHHG